MEASTRSQRWSEVLRAERAAIREPDGQSLGPDRPLTGLAFSGGGIRSATFNLGIIQALSELRLLRHFDYLSCVSGGGYLGGWLSAFIQRQCAGRVEDAEDRLHTGGAEDPAVRFLRGYSNYLTPKSSLLSADTLSAVATFVRNLYLNITLLILVLASLLLLPRLLLWGIRVLVHDLHLASLFVTGTALLGLALLAIGFSLGSRRVDRAPFFARQSGVLTFVVVPLLLSAWFIAYGLYAGAGRPCVTLPQWAAWGLGVYVGFYLLGELLGLVVDRRRGTARVCSIRNAFAMLLYAAIAGAAGGLLLAAVAQLSRYIRGLHLGYMGAWIATSLGTPVLLNAYSLAVVVHIGLMGRRFSHEAREWWSRLGGWLLLTSGLWLAVFAIASLAPAFFYWAHGAFVAAGGVTWATSTVLGVLLGRSARTSADVKSGWRNRIAVAMPYVFIVGLLGLLALGLYYVLTQPALCPGCAGHPIVAQPTLLATLDHDASSFSRVPVLSIAGLLLLCGSVASAMAWRLDVNLFSLYYFYRQRLVRCYLGASRDGSRNPHPLTGFDPLDDLALTDLCRRDGAVPICQRPYPIFNTALNLVAGQQLAWQERRAAAFALTPLTSGYGLSLPDDGSRVEHYRPSTEYMAGIWLGSAMAISGAAASPNMGYHSSPALTFLMTVFNARLGHWSPNPASDTTWARHDPPFGGAYLIRELLGDMDLGSPYVYLSDGGHFENLGIYELVRRRCACIIAIDAGQDADGRFNDLGNAIRKCYADFGVTIDVDTTGLKNSYFVLGRIHYPDAPAADLLYIKPALIGGEPADLANYQATHRQFPHESTADQWFDESQFESYRKLGHHIGRSVLASASEEAEQRRTTAGAATDLPLPWICELLRERQPRSPGYR
jgi:hypothetical protein